jgi:TPP-dependent pyruvate/acetoin dehydrogenase alpha subunit
MPPKAAGGSLISDARLKDLYASMLRSRLLTEHARRLRKRRATAFYRAAVGQEAITTGCVIDLTDGDAIVDTVNPEPSPASLVKGVALRDLVAQLGVRASQNPSPSWQLKLATAAGEARKEQNTNVVVVFSGADSTVGLRGALRFAAELSLPMIFVVENNPWGRKGGKIKNLNTETKGLTSITVDGNDVVAVYRVAYESLQRVRQGGGPVLIEGKTYHQNGRGPVRSERDPLAHMEQYLAAKGLFTQRWKEQLMGKFTRELEAAVKS